MWMTWRGFNCCASLLQFPRRFCQLTSTPSLSPTAVSVNQQLIVPSLAGRRPSSFQKSQPRVSVPALRAGAEAEQAWRSRRAGDSGEEQAGRKMLLANRKKSGWWRFYYFFKKGTPCEMGPYFSRTFPSGPVSLEMIYH